MRLVGLIKMRLNETYSRVRVGRILYDIFPIRNYLKPGDALSPLPLNFALEYAIRRVQVKQGGLKLKVTNQLLVYADDVNILGGNLHSVENKAQTVVVASKEIRIQTNVDKHKYTVMSRDQNAGKSHNAKLIIAPLKDWKSSNIW
jgi:hypothetical protein